MAKPTKFIPKQTPEGWRLNIPAKFSHSGKRERHFFRTRELAMDAAKALRDQRETFGDQARAIAPSLAEQATAAAKLLEPYGVTLLEAVQRFVEIEKRNSLSVPIENALKKFRTVKEARSAKQVDAYGYMAKALEEDFAGRTLSSITGGELGDHVEARTGGPGAFNQRLRLIAAFWRWCAKPPREWCDAKEIQHVERKDTMSAEIGTLTAKEAQTLMATAEKHFPECVPAFAIALFTGMRKQEIERLLPADVNTEGITVPATSAKTRRRRFIHMPAPLDAWLAAYPIGETICPANWARKEKAVRRLAGWKVWTDLIEPPQPPEDAPEWPDNALRHTAASVALALGKPIETLVFEHGHAGGLQTLRNHYIGRMPKKEALAIWSIGPYGKKLSNFKAA